jgi:heptosyltransferase I
MDSRPIKSIAILRLGALGDVCLTIPLIRTLQRHLPQTEIVWIISRAMYAFVEGLSGVRFIIVDKPKSLKDYWRCYQMFKQYHFDALLVPQATMRSNLLCMLINAKQKYGYKRLHSRDGQRFFVNRTVTALPEHLLDSFMRFAEPFGITDKVIDWQLPLSEADWQWAKQQLSVYPGKWLAICPAASKPERNWFIDRYVQVVNELADHWEFNVVLIGGPSELEKQMAKEIRQQLKTNCVDLVGKSTLKQLTTVVGCSDVVISPDTGPAHIATAMRIPVVGLYAVAPAEKTGPYFSQATTVNKFAQAVQTILHKDPAKVWWHERVHSQEAMKLISVAEVLEKLNRLFAQLNFPIKNKINV